MPFPKLSWSAFKDPYNILILFLTVYSLIASYIIFNRSQQHREISYRIVANNKVYDNSSSSPKLRLLATDQTPITNDVYVASFQFWNSGTLPIEPADVRRPMQLGLVNGDVLLDWKIAYSIADSDVCRFRISPFQTNGPVSILNLAWDHFDLGRGCQVQVMFMGNSNTAIGLQSPFSGNGEFTDTNLKKSKRASRGNLISGCFIACAVLTFIAFFVAEMLTKKRWLVPIGGVICYFLLLSALVISHFAARAMTNPFPPDVPISFKAAGSSGS